MNGECGGIGFEAFAELLRFGLAIRGAGGEGTLAVLIHDDRERRLRAGLERAHRHRERFAFERNQGRERQATAVVEPGYPNLLFAALGRRGAEQKNLWLAVAVPIRHGQIAYADQRGKSLWLGERAIGLLQVERDFSALRFGPEKVRKAVAVHVGPQQAAPWLVGFVERQHLKLALQERAGKRLGGPASEL